MEKKTLIFDASVLVNNIKPSSTRSGIFFTEYNILKRLIKSDKFVIFLYCNNEYDSDTVKFVHDNFGNNIEIYFGNRYGGKLKKLQKLDLKLRESRHNILKLLLKYQNYLNLILLFHHVMLFLKKYKQMISILFCMILYLY